MIIDEHWQKIGKHPQHGICLPLFSLRREKSIGVGEFFDLLPLIDWCSQIGFEIIQLLPIQDSGVDPSPYNPISSCALDPIYLSLSDLNISFKEDLNHRLFFSRKDLLKAKIPLLFDYFKKSFESISKTEKYLLFVKKHVWLNNYAIFKALKDQFNYFFWKTWPKNAEPDPEKIEFYTFLQFLCFEQMEKVKAYADKKKIKLKGDLPFLINEDSADVWGYSGWFDLKHVAGSPPDIYRPNGQYWGFPILNSKKEEKNDFAWWKMRLAAVQDLYHIYRIDHAVGFFRIFAIPKGKPIFTGKYFPANRASWKSHGEKRLKMMLETSPLMPIAEDLGTVHKEILQTLKKLQMPRTKIVRFERTPTEFFPLESYDPLSMTTLSNHDMDPLALWWKKHPVDAALFAKVLKIDHAPILSLDNRLHIFEKAHQNPSIFHINPLQEYLGFFNEMIFSNPDDERINRPGTLSAKNWTYRFKVSLEKIIEHPKLFSLMRSFSS